MPRFVILKHETAAGVHFDFMLEMCGVLKTWSLPGQPAAGMEIDAEALPDHRLAYLEYEGPVSGGRGSVVRWDRGMYDVEKQTESEWSVRLCGEKIIGRITLLHSPGAGERWQMTYTS